jgi:NAD dependent epimerase/dehydratase family enzyme
LQGPVNVVAPQPVTNQAFTTTLGKVLQRPCCWPVHA